MNRISINYTGFLNSSGYAIAAQDYILALNQSCKYDIKVCAIGTGPIPPALSESRCGVLNKLISNHHVTPDINILHCIPTMQTRYKKGTGKYLGFATYETYDPPQNWFDILNSNDGIITPSLFNYKIFSCDKIKKPVFYIPHCLDMSLYHSDIKPMYEYDKFSFLFLGTWKKRKGYEQLIEAFLSEFSNKDNVQLVIKTDKTSQAEQYVANIKKGLGNKGFSPVLFESKVFNEQDISNFIKSFNCLIIPTSGEGYGLPGLQAMSLKVPVIITNFSGCQDYANEQTATLLEPEGFVFNNSMDSIPQFANKKWAFLSVKQIREKMRYVVENQSVISQKAEYGYNFARETFNYAQIEKAFDSTIGQILNG